MKILKNQLVLLDPNVTIAASDGGSYAKYVWCPSSIQIEWKLRSYSAIAEMLVQSRTGFLHVLPALPTDGKPVAK